MPKKINKYYARSIAPVDYFYYNEVIDHISEYLLEIDAEIKEIYSMRKELKDDWKHFYIQGVTYSQALEVCQKKKHVFKDIIKAIQKVD